MGFWNYFEGVDLGLLKSCQTGVGVVSYIRTNIKNCACL